MGCKNLPLLCAIFLETFQNSLMELSRKTIFISYFEVKSIHLQKEYRELSVRRTLRKEPGLLKNCAPAVNAYDLYIDGDLVNQILLDIAFSYL